MRAIMYMGFRSEWCGNAQFTNETCMQGIMVVVCILHQPLDLVCHSLNDYHDCQDMPLTEQIGNSKAIITRHKSLLVACSF